jgi:hypothetical protein
MDNEFTLAKKTPTRILKTKKIISIDMNSPYYKNNKITIKKHEQQLKDDLTDSKSKKTRPSSVASMRNRSVVTEEVKTVSYTPYIKKNVRMIRSNQENSFENNSVKYQKHGRPTSVSATPMKPSKKVTTEEVDQTINSMLERFKLKAEMKQKNLDLLKLMKKEEEAANLIYKPKILNKKFKLSDDDFLKRQEIYKEQLDKKIRELKELQLQKKTEFEKADPSYGVHLEEQEIQEKIDWMIQWKEKVIKRNLERKKELAKKIMEECTFQPNIGRNSIIIAENNPGKRMRVDRFQDGENRGKSAQRVRNKSVQMESRPNNSKISSNEDREDQKNSKTNLKEKKTNKVIKADRPSIPTKNSKVYVPILPSERGSKINGVSHPNKRKSDASIVIKNGIFDEKEIDNLELMNIIKNKQHGGSDTAAGEISMKNKKVLPKLSDKDYEIMQELFIKKMNLDNGN